MSSTRQRGKDYSFSLKSPHFFKVILEGTITAGKLGIPTKFVEKYGKNLPNVMFLSVRNGLDWQVELSRHNGDVWLHNGWREFAEHYSLDYGHFLVFEYNGCSQFYVMIFDKGATEINYSCYDIAGVEEPNFDVEGKESETEKTVNDDSVEILDGLTTSKRARASFESFHPHKKIRNNSASQTKHGSMSVPLSRQNDCQCNGSKPGNSSCSLKEFGDLEKGAGIMSGECRMSKSGFVERTLSLTSEEKAKALERASGFQSENPYFVIAIQPAYVCRLAIPVHFSRKHLGEKQSNVTLCVSDGRTWSAQYTFYGGVSQSSVISNGWSVFFHDSSLRVGDVCALELIRTCEIKFKVFIFRAVEDTNPRHSLGNENRPNSDEPRRSLETNIVSDCTCKNESGICGLWAGGTVTQKPSCLRNADAVKEANKF